jgi:DNA polymerase III epsilon subunit-like protein
MNRTIIVIDIETSGANWNKYDLLAIGLIAIKNGKLIDSELICCYRENCDDPSIFDCNNNFWIDNKNVLQVFKYKGKKSKDEMYISALHKLFVFRKTHESEDCIYVSDNPVFDFGFLNALIFRYEFCNHGFPYLLDGQWQNYASLSSILEIIYCLKPCKRKLFAMLKLINTSPKVYKKISQLYNDKHNPVSDAHRIGLLYITCMNYVSFC